MQLSLDGVLESKSSLSSLDTYSVKFHQCRNIYPIRLIKPCHRFKFDEQEQLRKVLSDINENEIEIDCTVLDKIKRSSVTCTKGHSAKFGCEYCSNCAISHVVHNKKVLADIEKRYVLLQKNIKKKLANLRQEENIDVNKINNLEEQLATLDQERDNEIRKSGRKQLTWPASTMEGNLRTKENIQAIVNEIKNNPNILQSKGIKGESLLLNQPNFDIIEDSPCEYMHSVCLGLVKRTVSLTFKVGENRQRITKRKLSDPKIYNDKIRLVQVFREFSRRCRNLDFSVMKASEFRHIVLFSSQ